MQISNNSLRASLCSLMVVCIWMDVASVDEDGNVIIDVRANDFHTALAIQSGIHC